MNELFLAYAGAAIVGLILVWMALRNYRSGYRSRPEDVVPPPPSILSNASQGRGHMADELAIPDHGAGRR
jgi:hypothetical protein